MLKKVLVGLPLLVIVALIGVYFYVNNVAKTLVDTRLALAMEGGMYQALEYEEVKVHLNGDISLTNFHVIDIESNEYILQNILISDMDYQHDIPWHMNIAASGLTFPSGIPAFGATENSFLNQYLETLLEDDNIPVFVNYQYDYNPEDSYLLNSDVEMGLANAANLSFSSIMRNVPLEQLNATNGLAPDAAQQQLMSTLMNAEIPSASIAVEDTGIISALLNIQAEQTGMSPDDFRALLISQSENMYLFAPEGVQDLARDVSAQLAEFLGGNKTFNISIAPEFGGNIQQLQPQIMGAAFTGDFATIIDMLHLEIITQ